MRRNPSSEDDLRAALQRKGVSGRSLEAVFAFFEEEDYLKELAEDDDERRDYVDHLVGLGIREARRLKEFEGAGPSAHQVEVQHRQPDALATAKLWLLLQQLVIRDVARSPPVRNWRRQYLGGPESVLTDEAAKLWILKNTTDWDSSSPHRVPSEPFIWHLFDDPLVRGVPEESPVYSLRELTKSLADSTGWHERDAMIWVLTDRLPPVSDASVSLRYREFGLTPTVVLEVSAWLSDRQVAGHYRHARRRLVRRRPAPSHKVLEMTRFVLDNPRLPWEDRWREWNTTHPNSRYNSAATMKRVYYELRRKLQIARSPMLRRFPA